MPKSCVISNERLNSYGFYLLTEGGDLSQYKKNPVLLWMHNRAWRGTKDEVSVIGRMENIRVKDGEVLGDPVFDMNDEFAAEIGRKWEEGFLKMVSAGVKAIEVSADKKYIKPGQTRETITKWKLKEVSIVDIGSNDDSMAFYDADDKLITLSDDPDQEIPIKKLVDNQNLDIMDEITLADGKTKLTADDVQKLYDDNEANKETITTLTTERDTYKTKVEGFELAEKERTEAEAISLIDAAVKDGRIDATPNKEGKSAKEHWQKFFENDFEGAKATLASIPARSPKSVQLKDDEGNPTEREELAKLSWDDLDSQNKLEVLKDKYYDLFEEKFEQKFSKKPTKK